MTKLGPKRKKKVCIGRMHRVIEEMYGKADFCEICGRDDKKTRYDWSNKKHDYNYPIKIGEWRQLCRSCHIIYDTYIISINRRGKMKKNWKKNMSMYLAY